MVDYASFQLLKTLKNEGKTPVSLTITRDSQRLISAGGGIKIWQLPTGALLQKVTEVPWWPDSLQLSPDETTLYCMEDSEIHIWDFPSMQLRLKTGESLDEAELSALRAVKYNNELDEEDYEGRREGRIQAMVVDPHRQKIYVARRWGDMSHWDMTTQQWMRPGLDCSALVMSSDGAVMVGRHVGTLSAWQLFAPKSDFPVRIYRRKEVREATQSKGELAVINTLAISHDGSEFYSGYYNGDVEVWSTHRFESLGLLQGHQQRIKALTLSPDGQVLASADETGVIKLWHLPTQAELVTLTGHTKWIEALVFSPDGKLLVSSSADKTIRFWGVSGALT